MSCAGAPLKTRRFRSITNRLYLMIFSISSPAYFALTRARISHGTPWGMHRDGLEPKTRVKLMKISIRTGTALQTAPPPGRLAPEGVCATPQPAIPARDRSHAHASRTLDGPGRIHRQLVTGRRYTGLTVTFSRPFESRIWPPNGSQEGLALSVLRTTVSPPSLGTADQPHRAGAGAGPARAWTSQVRSGRLSGPNSRYGGRPEGSPRRRAS